MGSVVLDYRGAKVLNTVIGPKMVAALEKLNGSDQTWLQWSYAFKGRLNHTENTLTIVETNDQSVGLLFALLATCRGKAGVIVKKTRQKGSGLLACGRLKLEYVPNMVGLFNTMLMSLLNPQVVESHFFWCACRMVEYVART